MLFRSVDCGIVVLPEKCPEPVTITIEGCEDTLEFDAGDVGLESLGRILKLDVTLKNICPHKRVALAVILTEVDSHGIEHSRLFGEYYYSPDSLSSGIKSYEEANAGARYTIMRPVSIEAGYRYLNLSGKDGNRDNAVADGPYVGVNASF